MSMDEMFKLLKKSEYCFLFTTLRLLVSLVIVCSATGSVVLQTLMISYLGFRRYKLKKSKAYSLLLRRLKRFLLLSDQKSSSFLLTSLRYLTPDLSLCLSSTKALLIFMKIHKLFALFSHQNLPFFGQIVVGMEREEHSKELVNSIY